MAQVFFMALPTEEILDDSENADIGRCGCLVPTGEAEVEGDDGEDSDDED